MEYLKIRIVMVLYNTVRQETYYYEILAPDGEAKLRSPSFDTYGKALEEAKELNAMLYHHFLQYPHISLLRDEK
jgi:hypothetical protein